VVATKTKRPGPPRRQTGPAKRQTRQKASRGHDGNQRHGSRLGGAPREAANGAGLRLHVILSRAGIASRRHAEELIRDGKVTLNGKVTTKLGTRADPERDHIKVEGKLIAKFPRHEYFAYHKPVGFVTTLSDPQGRPCVGEVIERLGHRLYPVGRLDFHSSGLLLLTNDGELCARLTHPRSHVEKRYVAKLTGIPTQESIERLRRGVDLREGKTEPAYVRLQRTAANKAWMELRITEGRNRQVRRMLEAVGLRVEKLRRTAMGPITLGSLPAGGVRRLTNDELSSLRHAAHD
jgi:23S rRNA pseudouridine2605 synthase